MKTNNKLRVILVTLFRIFVHILTYAIFIAGFFPRYQGIRSFTRTLAVITASFTFMTAWMTYVYGKIDIGVKKTRPLFHTIALNLLITDAVTFIAVIVMTVNNKTVPFWQDLLAVLVIYIIQLIVTRILIGAANSLYFSNYTPEKTLIIQDNSEYLPKVIKYLERHKKQYEIVEVIDKRSVRDICFNEIDHVFMIDMDFEFIRCVALKCMMLDVNLYYNASIAAVTLSNKETFMVDDILFFLHKTNRITFCNGL